MILCVCVCVCVYMRVCVYLFLVHITAQTGPVMLTSLSYSYFLPLVGHATKNSEETL